jgi:pantoate--beta-alanine ligase
MRVVNTVADLQAALPRARRVALVPTMGNLHDGHLSLVLRAQNCADFIVTSVFVNRLQFSPREDFAAYPRTLERDCALLSSTGCDVVFAPPETEIYPEPQRYELRPPRGLADILEGQIRPRFFTGVCTVVLKLFNMVQPAAAVFGKKDYQQLLVIRDMVRQLALPIDIVHAETIRDATGLALSSRNGYLSESQRVEAAQLSCIIRSVADVVRSGQSDWRRLERQATETLTVRGWRPDYVALRRREDLGEPSEGASLVVLAAAALGGTRLIDNLEF